MKCATPIIIVDNDINSDNAFWKPHIGKRGTFICEESDGLYAISLDDTGVIDGVSPERVAAVHVHRPWWKRLLRIGNSA